MNPCSSSGENEIFIQHRIITLTWQPSLVRPAPPWVESAPAAVWWAHCPSWWRGRRHGALPAQHIYITDSAYCIKGSFISCYYTHKHNTEWLKHMSCILIHHLALCIRVNRPLWATDMHQVYWDHPHLFPQRVGINQLSIVCHCNLAMQCIHHKGLAVLQLRDPSGWIACVTNTKVTIAQLLKSLGWESSAH